MSISVDKLLALKAFQLGTLANANPTSRPSAVAMLDGAIQHLVLKEDSTTVLRLAFYHLARAEMVRYDSDLVTDRQAAQHLCKLIRSELYEYFMRIEEATTRRTREPKRDGAMSAYGNTCRSEVDILASSSSLRAWLDIALGALDESSATLTPKQAHFVEHTNLSQLFERHGIPYVP